MERRTFGRWPVAISYVLHHISAVIMLGGIFISIYLSTIGEPGTLQAMTRGSRQRSLGLDTPSRMVQTQVTGRDPVEACEEARRSGQMVRK